jgi:hypothetical protein
VLKKAGIVVAAGAASMVALSPLAFAGDKTDVDYKKNSDNKSYSKSEVNKQFGDNADQLASKDSAGLVNISGNNLNVSPQACGTAFNGNSLVQGALGGLFSEAKNSSGVTSDNGVDCTNASDNGDEVNQNSSESGKHGGSHK